MGTNSTYFFVPFKPNGSLNPVIPKENYEYFNFLFGSYFAEALDEIGTLYLQEKYLIEPIQVMDLHIQII